jgi:hypothetical protein
MKNSLIFLASFFIAIGIFAWAENHISPGFQSCASENATGQSIAQTKRLVVGNFLKTQAVCSLSLVDRHNGFFAALAAIVVAAFTGTLWIATDRLAKSGQTAFEATERAFVFIDGFDFELTTRADIKGTVHPLYEGEPQWHQDHPGLVISRFALRPRWKNGGNTPTKNMKIQVDWRHPSGSIPPPEYSYRTSPEHFFLAPKAVELTETIELPQAAGIVNWSMSQMGVEPLILVWGRADYEDVFSRKHFVEWCYRLRLSRTGGERMRASMIQWGEYNRTDDGMRA